MSETLTTVFSVLCRTYIPSCISKAPASGPVPLFKLASLLHCWTTVRCILLDANIFLGVRNTVKQQCLGKVDLEEAFVALYDELLGVLPTSVSPYCHAGPFFAPPTASLSASTLPG